MVRTPVFWLTYVLFVAVAAGGLMATAQIGPIAKDYGLAKLPMSLLGFTLPLLTMTLAIDNLANGFTRPLCGFISDRIGRENTMMLVFVGEGLALLGLMKFGHEPVAVHDLRRAGVPVLGRDLLDLPGAGGRHLRRQERGGQRRHDVHGQGHGLAAGAADLGAARPAATGTACSSVAAAISIVAGLTGQVGARTDAPAHHRRGQRARGTAAAPEQPAQPRHAACPAPCAARAGRRGFRSCRAASAGSASRPRGSGRTRVPSSECGRTAPGACAGSASRVPAHPADAA